MENISTTEVNKLTIECVECVTTNPYEKKEYRSEEPKIKFCGWTYSKLAISDYNKEETSSWDSKIPKNAYFENSHQKVIHKLLNCFGVCNKHFDATRPNHFACVSNRPIVSDSNDIEIPRNRIMDNLTSSIEVLKVKIVDHKYKSKKYQVTWQHFLDRKSIKSKPTIDGEGEKFVASELLLDAEAIALKRKNEQEKGHSFQLNKAYFSPTLILGIILYLVKKSKGCIHLDEKSYLDRIMWSFSQYPQLEITVYFHHPDKDSDYKFDQVMRNVMLSNIYYKTKVDMESQTADNKKISHFDKQLSSEWTRHGVNVHAERDIKKKYCGYDKKYHKVQADLVFGKKIEETSDFKQINILQILYKDIVMPEHKLQDLLEHPYRFFDIVNLPSTDTTSWRFPDQYVPLRFKRSNKNIHTLAYHESVHIYPTRKGIEHLNQVLKNETTESTESTETSDPNRIEIIQPVEDNEWTMFIASPSEAYPIFIDNRKEALLQNDFIHPYFTINDTETTQTCGYYFVYRFIHIKTDCLRLYDIGITVKIYDENDELQVKPPKGKDLDMSHESFSAVIKAIEKIVQKKLNVNFFRLPEKDQNPKYYVWTAKEHYPRKLDEKSIDAKLKNISDKPFFTVASYLNGVDRF